MEKQLIAIGGRIRDLRSKKGYSQEAFADSCRLVALTRGSATVTCSYGRDDAPAVRDAVALNVVASG